MIGRTFVALVMTVTIAGAVDAPGLDAPLKNPTAKRLRSKAQQKWEAAHAIYARHRNVKTDEERPTADDFRKAVALAGGLADHASVRKIFRLPEGGLIQGQRIRVDLDDKVMPGDTITVEESFF